MVEKCPFWSISHLFPSGVVDVAVASPSRGATCWLGLTTAPLLQFKAGGCVSVCMRVCGAQVLQGEAGQDFVSQKANHSIFSLSGGFDFGSLQMIQFCF